MKLSYSNRIFGDPERRYIEATITTDHPASHYGQPVIVLPDGNALDLTSWVMLGYRVEEATPEEWAAVEKMFAGFGIKIMGEGEQ